MRICIISEGCYPYVVGGVSGWVHSMIQTFPKQEFILLSVIASREQSGRFAYKLPENVKEVHEVYLQDSDWGSVNKQHKSRLTPKEYHSLRSLMLDQNVEWSVLFDYFRNNNVSINQLLMGEDFYHAAVDCYNLQYPDIVFSDFLWTMRSMYLPLFLALSMEVPKADIYHAVSTGYAGIIGSMGKYFHNGQLIISEHGIYTREREEELIKAEWVQRTYKKIWIRQFKKMSKVAYETADVVTGLYKHASELQEELGCPKEKLLITPNGIDYKRFENLPAAKAQDADYINIGAILRVAPIKDVKTMIQAFAYAKKRCPKLKLWIMGPYDEEPEYAAECFKMAQQLEISDIEFTGRIQVTDYLGRLDMTILTSISEGQPLTILESFAARVPVIATDVGNCRGLLYGEDDDFGKAGILTHIMNIEEIGNAMVYLAENPKARKQMADVGYRRLMRKYKIEDMKKTYEGIYRQAAERLNKVWEND
jgi:glycosyltransferase involved in cell wall biosynthesis